MSAARRSHRKRDWPRGLYEPRPGYYTWRHPTTGQTLVIGRVSLAIARNEAIAANAHVLGARPSLVARLSGAVHTVADLLAEMPAAATKNTEKSWRSQDKVIREALGEKQCGTLTVADCAGVVEPIAKAGKNRWAQAIRSRLIAVCKRGMQLGWMNSNPAEVTADPKPMVKRGRLTLEQFQAIHTKAPEVAEWLPLAMMLALVTGQDRSTVAGMERVHISGEWLTVWRTKTRKTNKPVDIPLALRMDAVGVSLSDLVKARTGVLSKFLVHHVNPWGNAPAGSKVHPDRISHAFTEARKLAKIPDEGAPTFHEIRSLTKRLYDAQGNVDTKALLGHATQRMSDLYADPRGVEHIRVSVRQVNKK
jgi:integrase